MRNRTRTRKKFKPTYLGKLIYISNAYAYQYDLSICTIFRDEAPYLKEWIEYHRMLGAQHFYLCSHNSVDNYRDVLDPYIRNGIVELKEIWEQPDANHRSFCFGLQVNWYNQCINEAKNESKWIAFLDADEFLCLLEGNSLVEFLKNYEEFGGVSVNWFMFGTSNIAKLSPSKLMIEQLTSCFEAPFILDGHNFSLFLKCIIQPKYAIKFPTPHNVEFIPGYFSVNPNKESLVAYPIGIGPALFDKLRINHYWTRDEEYFWKIKVPRQHQLHGPDHHTMALYHFLNRTKNFEIQKFVPELRKRMGLD